MVIASIGLKQGWYKIIYFRFESRAWHMVAEGMSEILSLWDDPKDTPWLLHVKTYPLTLPTNQRKSQESNCWLQASEIAAVKGMMCSPEQAEPSWPVVQREARPTPAGQPEKQGRQERWEECPRWAPPLRKQEERRPKDKERERMHRRLATEQCRKCHQPRLDWWPNSDVEDRSHRGRWSKGCFKQKRNLYWGCDGLDKLGQQRDIQEERECDSSQGNKKENSEHVWGWHQGRYHAGGRPKQRSYTGMCCMMREERKPGLESEHGRLQMNLKPGVQPLHSAGSQRSHLVEMTRAFLPPACPRQDHRVAVQW